MKSILCLWSLIISKAKKKTSHTKMTSCNILQLSSMNKSFTESKTYLFKCFIFKIMLEDILFFWITTMLRVGVCNRKEYPLTERSGTPEKLKRKMGKSQYISVSGDQRDNLPLVIRFNQILIFKNNLSTTFNNDSNMPKQGNYSPGPCLESPSLRRCLWSLAMSSLDYHKIWKIH